ncbi:MAG TPA: hydroxyphenylacetyl-CoA thioesterase PaaI [Gemmatimonadaceae bacterium]|mgnify:CR=1 FL=1|nr:hydroxyphenylacetyl-CoA thioesterase PaaI [Gemmatimonadaceae bacterium]
MNSPSNDPQRLAERVVEGMMATDALSRWLGLEVVAVAPRHATCRMTVRPEMVNGFGVAHGGIVFSLADSAFACACNTHGTVTVAVDNTITYPAAIHPGDVLTAVADEEAGSNRLGYYRVVVTNQHDRVVALFKGTAYKTSRPHFPDETSHA